VTYRRHFRVVDFTLPLQSARRGKSVVAQGNY